MLQKDSTKVAEIWGLIFKTLCYLIVWIWSLRRECLVLDEWACLVRKSCLPWRRPSNKHFVQRPVVLGMPLGTYRDIGVLSTLNLLIYRGSPASMVSTSTISTCTNFSAIGIKFVLVGLLCSKIRTSGNCLCSTHQYEFRIVRFFPNPKNRTKRGLPVLSNLSAK